MLQEYLGGLELDATTALVSECGWSLNNQQEGDGEAGGMVFIRNQDANIRPKKILAKIDFDSEWAWPIDMEWVGT